MRISHVIAVISLRFLPPSPFAFLISAVFVPPHQLYKYLCKGSDRIEIARHYPDIQHDEILNHEYQRYVSATEAFARMMDIRLHYSNISVTMVPLHLEGAETVPLNDAGSEASDDELAGIGDAYVSRLTRYFLRPSVSIFVPELAEKGVHHMDDILVTDYENFFHHEPKLPRGLQHHRPSLDATGAGRGDLPRAGGRRRGAPVASAAVSAPSQDSTNVIWTDRAVLPQQVHYVWYKTRRTVTRLPSFLPTLGELYYLRMLLLKLPARSHSDLKRFNGHVYATYREAAVARGIIPDGREAQEAMRAAIASPISTPACHRDLFCAFLLHSSDACNPVELFTEFWEQLSADITHPDWERGMPEAARRGGMTDALLQVTAVYLICLSLIFVIR